MDKRNGKVVFSLVSRRHWSTIFTKSVAFCSLSALDLYIAAFRHNTSVLGMFHCILWRANMVRISISFTEILCDVLCVWSMKIIHFWTFCSAQFHKYHFNRIFLQIILHTPAKCKWYRGRYHWWWWTSLSNVSTYPQSFGPICTFVLNGDHHLNYSPLHTRRSHGPKQYMC